MKFTISQGTGAFVGTSVLAMEAGCALEGDMLEHLFPGIVREPGRVEFPLDLLKGVLAAGFAMYRLAALTNEDILKAKGELYKVIDELNQASLRAEAGTQVQFTKGST